MKQSILLVDDEHDIVSILKERLEKNGFNVDAFTDPFAALACVKPRMYDILVIDVRMPGLSGFKLFREIRKIDPKSKVLFLTEFEVDNVEWQIVLPHVHLDTFLKKPVSVEQLIEAIGQVKASRIREY